MSDMQDPGSVAIDIIKWVFGGIAAVFGLLLNVLWQKHNKEIDSINAKLETQRLETNDAVERIYQKIDNMDERNQDRHLELLRRLPQRQH